MCARWENFVVHLRTSRALSEPFLSSWQYSVSSFTSNTMNTRAEVFLCISNCSLGCKLALEQVISFCACVQCGRISWYICALPEHFQSPFKAADNTLLTLLVLTRWIHLRKSSYAYRTVYWDVNLHWNRWSPSAHVCKVGEFRGTSAHFQSTFRALFKQVTILC